MIKQSREKIKASECLSRYYLDAWGIDAEAELKKEVVSPESLMTSSRLDIACKLYYIDCMEKDADMAFARELYRMHIEAFSDGACIEPGINTKNNLADYCKTFESLIANIRENGFDSTKSVVPVGENGGILDGSHRVAACVYYDIPLTIVRIPGNSCNYDYTYFKDKGMSSDYLDFLAYQFIRFAEKVYTVCLWPAAYDHKKLDDIDRMIRGAASVVYRKEAFLNYHGVEKLMIAFYKHMEWIGSIDNEFSGVASKALDCYKTKAPVTVYVISALDLDEVALLKQRIRDSYAIGNSSVHITDTHSEALEAGEMLLFGNSIDFLNNGEPFANKGFFSSFIKKAGNIQHCASVDMALALYGICKFHDNESIENGTDLQHPKDIFFFWGVCLPSLFYIKNQKNNSSDPNDGEMVKLIEAFERKQHSASAVTKEYAGQMLHQISARVSRLFKALLKNIKRSGKVLYHRLKYRKQCIGKGEKDNEDLQTVFLNINTTTADYLIMRNWEGFYDDILIEGHNDIDVLCRDKDTRDIIVRLLDAKPLTFDGFHYCFKYRGEDVTLDTRIMGDGYYDRSWQRNMLKHKRMHPLGFFIMDHEDYYYSLIYHAIYQKKDGLSTEYAQKLNQAAFNDRILGQNDFANQLNSFMKTHGYAYTKTMDKSVVLEFGNTAIHKKICYPFSIRVHHFMERMKSKQLLQRLKIKIRKLIFRG